MRQRAAEPVELPHHQHIAGLDKIERLGQARPAVFGAGRAVLKYVARIDTGRHKRVTLQVGGLAIIGGRDAHVADKHVRKTPEAVFTYDTSKRQSFPHTFLWTTATRSASATRLSPNTCFPTPHDRST